jgi:hypothetical protein
VLFALFAPSRLLQFTARGIALALQIALDRSAKKNSHASKKSLTGNFSSLTFLHQKGGTSAMAAKKKKATTKKSSKKSTKKKK